MNELSVRGECQAMKVIAAVMLVLLSAAPATAECAWVLWQNYILLSKSVPEDSWKIFHAGAAEKACIDAMIDLKQKRTAFVKEQNPGAKIEIFTNEVSVRHASGTVMMFRFRCLPDTVAPRGPKRK